MFSLQDTIERLELKQGDGEERWTVTGVTWPEYENLLAKRGDRGCYRVTYFYILALRKIVC